MRDVLESKQVMRQSIATRDVTSVGPTATLAAILSVCAFLIAIVALLVAVR